jgi:hypothetical protein
MTALINCCGDPLGIEYSTETTHAACKSLNRKCSTEVNFPSPILAKEKLSRETILHQNRLCFSLPLSFAEAKESEARILSKQKRSICHLHNKTRC